MPRFEFYNIEKLIAMHNAINLDKYDPDDTLHLELTHKEVAILTAGVVFCDLFFPEYEQWTDKLISKVSAVTGAQDFFSSRARRRGLEDEPEGEDEIDE